MSALFGLSLGTVFAADFRVVRRVREGSRSAVYVVDQLSTGTQRTLEILRPDLVADAALRERFPRDARAGARIWSDYVAEVVAAGVDDATGLPWLAMELVQGVDLAKHLAARGSLPPAEAGTILGQICHALVAAHTAGVVHCGLAPEEILLADPRRPGEPPTVKILGFGLGKLVAESTRAEDAPSPWAAPEQTAAGSAVTPAVDIWSLGLLAFFLLTGRSFWRSAATNDDRATPEMLSREMALDPIPNASQRAIELGCGDRIPGGFDAWFVRCVAREPGARFSGPAEAQADLERILGSSAALSGGHTQPVEPGPGPGAWAQAGAGPYRSGGPAIAARPAKVPVLRVVALLAAGAGLGLLGVAALVAAFPNRERVNTADLAKIFIALTAAAFAIGDALSAVFRRPAPGWLQKAIGIPLGVAAIVAYFNGFSFAYPKYYHRWEQYHHYVGAKYFPELGYDNLYRCALIAQDEIGTVSIEARGRTSSVDLSKEARQPDKKIRNLGADNLLMSAADALERPEVCKARFSPERWERFKEDIKFFRIESDKGYWEDMQKDHGYEATPVWTIAGRFFGELHPASVGYLQFLSGLDLIYLLAMFAALWWAFGWRVSVTGAIFWGCQAAAPFYWTGGALLRQDWLFYLVFSACLARKRYFKLAGASMAYAALLRVFPGLTIIGWLTVFGAYAVRHRRMATSHRQALLGGLLAVAVLVPLSLVAAGTSAYSQFYEHTFENGDVPLTNHMGLEVLITHDVGGGPGSGRMEYARDSKLVDPFETWKRMRVERYEKYRFIGYAIVALSIAAFVAVGRRLRSMWIAQCLGQVFVILLTRLTCFHYPFMVLGAPLTRALRWLEVPLFAFVALSQVVSIALKWNDDKYFALTAISLVLCYGLIAAFARVRSAARPRGGAVSPPAG